MVRLLPIRYRSTGAKACQSAVEPALSVDNVVDTRCVSCQRRRKGPPMNLSWSSSRRTAALVSLSAAAALALAGCGGSSSSSSGGSSTGGASGEKPIVGLITKTDTNPFFVKMKEGAQQAADK